MKPLQLVLLLSLLSLSVMRAQDNDPHQGKVPHCDNSYTTKENMRCDCLKNIVCPEPGSSVRESDKCKSYCYHGCNCVGACDT